MSQRTAVGARPVPSLQRGRGLTLAQRQARLAWLFLLPSLVVVLLVALVPLVQTIIYSLTDKRLGSVEATHIIGLKNYRFLLSDGAWWHAVWVTIEFTIITVFFEFLLGLLIALVVNSRFPGRGPMRAAMLVPWAIPTVLSSQMWKWMYNDIFGVVNDLLKRVGLIHQNIAWLARPDTALFAVTSIDIWKTTPFVALLLLAGLQVIPDELYEAATVDGASKVRQFFTVTLPLLRPAIVVALIFRTLDALRVFDVFYVLFGARADMTTMAVYAQNNIVAFSDVGYGSAISVLIFVIIGIFVVAYVTTLGVEQS
ncbi:carbohydrate ABC transporter permease [Thermorudis peleae]|uniref:carbohydrate ABC transporter permease n=1 Tax=Thermorudis peleae TaxID=1382356 RepID=UPI0009DEDF90|nr:sugar ABC transporter permease [Thermorudis peleae]MBX6752594.1 sugar ABC transporter permease [Thermorudis peleae]